MARKRRFIRIASEILFSGILIYLVFRNVPLNESLEYARQWNIWMLILAMLTILGAIVLRGIKWKLILHPLNDIPVIKAVNATNVGLMLNALLPVRPGDLYKAYASSSKSNPFTNSLLAVLYDRLLDVLVLFSMFIIAFVFLRNDLLDKVNIMGIEISQQSLLRGFDTLAIIILIGLTIIVLLNLRISRRILEHLEKKIKYAPVTWFLQLMIRFATASGKITQAYSNVFYLIKVAIISILPWILFCVSIYLVSRGGPIGELNIFKIMFIAAMSLTAVQIPSVPGGWGLFETGVLIALLSTTRISPALAIPFAVIMHLTQYIPVIFAGLISRTIDFRLKMLGLNEEKIYAPKD